MSANRICWDRAAIEYATQVDVGGLEVGDPRADAVFHAIHHPLPVRRERDVHGGRTTSASEGDVLKAFTGRIDSNEPLLLFITGARGTGKSHLVRWLRSRIGERPERHVVYIEKRNTSLRKVTERILQGIETPKAAQLRQALAQASSDIASDEEAMSALLARLDQLVTFDAAPEIQTLPDVSPAVLTELRRKAHRLLGDFTFREELSRKNGPVHRIARLARGGPEPSEDVNEADLHLTEGDLQVDPSAFEDLGHEIQNLVASLVSSRALRKDIAALCDWYLPRAKAEVFTGQGTDLLDVFEDVRREIAARGQELCLFIEDLVLLHGIDRQLAQALTIPATAQLCKLRAAIAVTSGYLSSLDTFTDRGIHFTLDIDLKAIGPVGLRDFVGRYLNAGRLREEELAASEPGIHGSAVPNACVECPDRKGCHETFGISKDRYGLYPFNGPALDRLVELASPDGFRPREILREVIRAPLETAEHELPTGGTFPSGEFARTLDENRQNIHSTVRRSIRRANPVNPDAELSLRSFYAQSPPSADPSLERIAAYFGVQLSQGVADTLDDHGQEQDEKEKQKEGKRAKDEIEQWVNDGRLSAPTARVIRRWVCEAVIAQLQNGPYGVAISKPRSSEWRIGSHVLRLTDVDIERAQGAGTFVSQHPFRIAATDENAVVLRGILDAVQGESLDSVDEGTWFFGFQGRLSKYAETVAGLAATGATASLSVAVQALAVLRHEAADPGQTVREALAAMFKPVRPPQANPVVAEFLRDARPIRDEALGIIRHHATAVKGGGKPSLLDVGLIHREIQSNLKTRSVEGQFSGDDEDARLLRGLQARQLRAFTRAWAEVTKTVTEVARFLDPGEDLDATLKIVDKLVDDGHSKGMLPRADSRTVYQEARNKLETDVMEVYRRLSKKAAGETGPSDLWAVWDDPLPRLTSLGQYAAVTDDLLSGIADTLSEEAGGEVAADTEALIREFRELADALDKVITGGGR